MWTGCRIESPEMRRRFYMKVRGVMMKQAAFCDPDTNLARTALATCEHRKFA